MTISQYVQNYRNFQVRGVTHEDQKKIKRKMYGPFNRGLLTGIALYISCTYFSHQNYTQYFFSFSSLLQSATFQREILIEIEIHVLTSNTE